MRCAADGVFGDPAAMGREKTSWAMLVGEQKCLLNKKLLHVKQDDEGLPDGSENNPALLITVRDLLQLQRNVKTNQ